VADGVDRDFLIQVLNSAQEHVNRHLTVIALTALTARYYINVSTEHAEKMALMAHIGAIKGNDHLWHLVSGKLLAGIARLSPHPLVLLCSLFFY
jgi:Cohesin loading factor